MSRYIQSIMSTLNLRDITSTLKKLKILEFWTGRLAGLRKGSTRRFTCRAYQPTLKGGCAHSNMHILLTLTSEMHFVKFHPEVASCLLSRGKRKLCTPGEEAIMKIHKKLFSGIPINFTLFSLFLLYLQNYKEFEAEILDLQSEKHGLSFGIKKIYYFLLSPGG